MRKTKRGGITMLTLPIKKKWFDMILSGEKKEEYREKSKYWETRFHNALEISLERGRMTVPDMWVRFRNGYSRSSPEITAVVRLREGEGKPEWGAVPGKQYFILDNIRIICVWKPRNTINR